MKFPVVIHKEDQSDYGATIPDLPGCFSAGDSFEDALSQAEEAIECHLEAMLQGGEALVQPKGIEHHRKKREFRGGVWAILSVDVTKLSGKSRRVNITLPERILRQMDDYASRHGESRSGFIVQAAMEYLSCHENS